MLAVLLLQTAGLTPQTTTPPARKPCPVEAKADPEEILVCARRDPERYRLRPLPDRYVEKPAFDIDLPGGGSIEPRVAQGRFGEAQARVTLKLPF